MNTTEALEINVGGHRYVLPTPPTVGPPVSFTLAERTYLRMALDMKFVPGDSPDGMSTGDLVEHLEQMQRVVPVVVALDLDEPGDVTIDDPEVLEMLALAACNESMYRAVDGTPGDCREVEAMNGVESKFSIDRRNLYEASEEKAAT